MAAPYTSSAKAEKHDPLRPLRLGRHNYALPKGHCTNRSEWRLLPGKPPERLSPYYQLSCDFGTSLMISWRNEGGEPLYVCEAHAKELGYPADVCASAGKLSGPAGRKKEREASAQPAPIAGPEKASSAPPTAENSAPDVHREPATPDQSAAERCAAIDRQISEHAAQLENILFQSEAAICVVNAIDIPLEQATLEIIRNPAMTETQKDATVQQLGALQKSLKQDLGDVMTPLQAHRIKQTVGHSLSGNISVEQEAKPAYRAVHDSLENAIHAAVPEAKLLAERLADLFKTRAELEILPPAKEPQPNEPQAAPAEALA
jgi:hypothetical protein